MFHQQIGIYYRPYFETPDLLNNMNQSSLYRIRRGESAKQRQVNEDQSQNKDARPFFVNRTYIRMRDFYTSKARLNELKKKQEQYDKQQESISNRLMLMKNEEAKAKKQIEFTVKRAKSIEEYRKSKEQFLKKKEEKKYSDLEEVFRRRVHMIKEKNLRKLNIDLNRSFVSLRNKEDASEVKEYRKYHETKISNFQSEVLFTNILKAKNVKEQEKITEKKRQLQWEDVRLKAKLEYENKINEQEQKLKKKEAEVITLEQRKENYRKLLEQMSFKRKRALSMYEKVYNKNARPQSERTSENKNLFFTSTSNTTPIKNLQSEFLDEI